MPGCSNDACNYEQFTNSTESDMYMNVVRCEQDSGFEDLVEYVEKETTDEISVLQNFSKDTQVNIAKEEPPGNKRGRGRPPKRHDNQFECDICNFITAYATHFRIHMSQTHQEEQLRIFKCTLCSEAYVEERFLREHIKHIHNCIPRQPKLICDKCGKGFPKQSHLTRHSYVHNPNEKPFLCEQCPKRFPSQSSLARHMEAKHVKKKPHSCDVCGKCFGHIYGLKAHKIRMHE